MEKTNMSTGQNAKTAHLHLWQQRNFSNGDDSCLHQDQHESNIAQMLSVSSAYECCESLSSVLLEDELTCLSSNKVLPSLHANSKQIFNKNDCNSILNDSNSYMNYVNTLLARSPSVSLWQKEIQKNPDLQLREIVPTPKSNALFMSNSSTSLPSSRLPGLTLNNTPKFCDQEQTFDRASSFDSAFHHQSSETPAFVREAKRKHDEVKDLNGDEISGQTSCFKSAREQMAINQKKKFQRNSPQGSNNKKSLGSRPRNQCYAKFIPPSNKNGGDENGGTMLQKHPSSPNRQQEHSEEMHPKLKGVDPQLIELVMSEIMDHGPLIGWDDIAGLEFAKATIKEIVIWPMLRPDIFTGLRGPPKGILLFGPPGTGKTLIGKCIANQSGATFFSISASSLTSKWIGQAEKMVRALFTVASLHQPAVIFIDEIDSLLSQRSDSEHESSRRIKTEFFVQLDGATTSSDDRILVVGATNRPQEIDEAARRRLVKRLYIPLPDGGAREQIITKLMKLQPCVLSQTEIDDVVKRTEGYSGADVTNLCKDAALGPIRSLQVSDISRINKSDVRPINIEDFRKSLHRVRASVSQKDLLQYEEWNKIYGCGTL